MLPFSLWCTVMLITGLPGMINGVSSARRELLPPPAVGQALAKHAASVMPLVGGYQHAHTCDVRAGVQEGSRPMNPSSLVCGPASSGTSTLGP